MIPFDKPVNTSLGIKLMPLAAGEFFMGSSSQEVGRQPDETLHRVRISKPFLLSITAVTQGQWTAVMNGNPSHFKGDDQLPVEMVSWNDAKEFCRKLSVKEGRAFRLPTEAEWEYACRSGTQTRFSGGDSDSSLGQVAWFRGKSSEKTHPVGEKRANAWGLHDMHGNIAEWCEDVYNEDYPSGTVQDPKGPKLGRYRVARGGSWIGNPHFCRAATRDWFIPDTQSLFIGFRVASQCESELMDTKCP